MACGHFTRVSAPVVTSPPPLSDISLCVILVKVLTTAFRTHVNCLDWFPQLEILNLIAPAKIRFLYKIRFTGRRG